MCSTGKCTLTPQAWQDDEWQVQDNHHDLGVAVGKASHVYNGGMLMHDDIACWLRVSCRAAASFCAGSCMQAYRAVRSAGENDIGSILLSIASDLEAFDFDETFTGNFEVQCLVLLP